MPRLPQVGGDLGSWGDILNDYLGQSLASDGSLKPGTVGAPQLRPGSVKNIALADGQVTSAKIVDGAVGTDQLADNTVSTAKLRLGSVVEAHLSPELQDKLNAAPSEIADGSVTSTKLADYAVTASKVARGTLTNAEVAPDADIAISKIAGLTAELAAKADGSDVVRLAGNQVIVGNKEFTGALTQEGNPVVTTIDGRLTNDRAPVDGSVSTVKIVDAAVTEAKLSSSVQAKLNEELADGTVSTAKLADGAVTNAKIADGSVGAAQLANASVSRTKLSDVGTPNGIASLGGDGRLPEGQVPLRLGEDQLSALSGAIADGKIAAANIPGQVTAGIASAVPPAIASALDTAGVVTKNDFAGAGGLYAFPGSTPVSNIVHEIDPTHYAASSSLETQNTTVTAVPIIVKPDSAPAGIFSVTSDGLSMQAIAGTSGLTCQYINVGGAVGVSRVTINGINAVGTASSFGGFTAGLFNTNDIRMLRWAVSGTSRVYVVQKSTGTVLTGLTSTTLGSATSVVAQIGDKVELVLTADQLLRLLVNGLAVFSYTLTSGEWTTFGTNPLAGVYSTPSAGASPKFGRWQWASALPTSLRKMVAVDENLRLPASVDFAAGRNSRFNIKDFGAKMDAIVLTDVSTTAGQPTVASAARPFTATDIGKTIAVMSAGPVVANANDGVWISTIQSVAGGVATLASNATTTITAGKATFGTPDDAAFAAAQVAAVAAGGGIVHIPQGRTIATAPLAVQNYVSWGGVQRDLSWVHVIADRPGDSSAAGTSDWLTCAGRNASNPLIGADFYDFGIEAEAMIHTAGYGSAVKPLNIYYVQRCSITRMNVWNTPATAVPFDHSYDQCSITYNHIKNPGRLAPSGVGPGGSGIGAGTKGTGATEPTLIAFNVIVGTNTASAYGPGQNGIFTEAQTGADPDLGVQGYRVVYNVIINMYYGISDAGATGTLIMGNDIIGCVTGIALRKTTLPDAYPGLHAIITENLIRGCTGPGAQDGIGIFISTPSGATTNTRDYIHAIVVANQVIESKSWGLAASANDNGKDITGLTVRSNVFRGNGRSACRFYAAAGRKIRFLAVTNNQMVGNGRAGIAGDQSAVLITTGTILEGGRIQDNDMYDLAGSPTQLATVTSTGATLTAVRVAGNTGDA
ncbi:hypothetical protein [uncultured Microbacterium sp.]|uniref:hypothetical protein n=1 Tax=uncultured Microbacterium sp. TaxID=191216 RepID=UPI0035CB7F02